MNKFFICLAATITISCAHLTANAETGCQMPITVEVSKEGSSMENVNISMLTNKLTQVVTSQGFGGNEQAYLCLSANISEVNKNVISGVRPIIATTMDVYLVIYNLITGDKYGATTISIQGSGNSETQTYQSAFSKINLNNPELLGFVRKAHDKLFSYYQNHLPAIIKNARVLADREEFEKALAILYTVPECVAGYEDVTNVMLEIWARYVNLDCARKLAKARSEWVVSKDSDGARSAAAYIAAIHPNSSCKQEALELLKEIESHLDAEQARLLALQMDDRAYERQKEQAELDMKRYELESARELSMAYIKALIEMSKNNKNTDNQPRNGVSGEGHTQGNNSIIIVK